MPAVHTRRAPSPDNPSPKARPAALATAALLALSASATQAQAQTPAPTQSDPPSATSATPPAARPASAAASSPTRSAPTPSSSGRSAPQRVEITGNRSDEPETEERRRSVAGRIVIGREELDQMGDNSVADVLKRLPGVTIGGPPGRGGGPRMRGMGGGYTQILIDGQRLQPGFSLDSIPPDQIERIEVMRAPIAEYGTRAIAGTINIVMRSDYKRRTNEWRAGGGVEGSRAQGAAGLTRNGENDTLKYNLTLNAIGGGRDSESQSHDRIVDADGNTTQERWSQETSRGSRQGVFSTARLQFKLERGSSLELQPFLNAFRSSSSNRTLISQGSGITLPAYGLSEGDSEYEQQMGRLSGNYNTTTASGGRLTLRFGGRLARSQSHGKRIETGGSAGLLPGGLRQRVDDSESTDRSLDLNGKFQQLLGESHSASFGWEFEHNRREDQRTSLINGLPDPASLEFGDNLEARVSRAALYAQDEWEWSKNLSFYVGARWEGIDTRSDSAAGRVSNRSSVFTPLAHLVYRLPDAPRDQLRLSLTRSYRSPSTNQLIARPSTNSQFPDPGQTNDQLHPDRAGNPGLKPELALGIEAAFEHYFSTGGLLSANVYWRRIDNLIRNVIALENPTWASAPRWVSRPQNIGQADAAGIELEARLRVSELWPTESTAQLRANTGFMWSRVDGVMGPDNRLEGQPKATLNLGLDWPLRGTPLTVGGNWNYTPGFDVRLLDTSLASQGRKSQLDLYALWRFNADAALRLSVTNAAPSNYDTGSMQWTGDGGYERSDTWTKTYTQVNLRAELRF